MFAVMALLQDLSPPGENLENTRRDTEGHCHGFLRASSMESVCAHREMLMLPDSGSHFQAPKSPRDECQALNVFRKGDVKTIWGNQS